MKTNKIKEEVLKGKFILDACCGGRMFWFNKHHPNTLYIDNRIAEKGHKKSRFNHEVMPDILMDFRKLEFPDKSFKLIVFDPPHLISGGNNFEMGKSYGVLNKETWKEDIKKGFDECWRVLDDYGVLTFKWNEASVKRKEILEVIGKEPLYGNLMLSKIPTHWFVFIKIPDIRNNE